MDFQFEEAWILLDLNSMKLLRISIYCSQNCWFRWQLHMSALL